MSSAAGRRRPPEAAATPEEPVEHEPLIKEADPELERLLAEEAVEDAVEEAAEPQGDEEPTDEGLGAEPQATAPAGGLAGGDDVPPDAEETQQADSASPEDEES